MNLKIHFLLETFEKCKIDLQNVPPAPASFPFLGCPGPNFTMANNETVLDYFELFFF